MKGDSIKNLDGPRASRPDEFPEIMRMLDEVFWVSKGKPPCMQRLYPWLNRPENYGHFFIYSALGKIVSHVSMNWLDIFCGVGKVRIGLVGGVATLPEYRGMGLAGNLLELVLEHMRSDACDIAVLWATGPRLYEKAGFSECGISYKAVLEGRALENLKSARDKVVPYAGFKEYTKGMAALHEGGPAPSIRPLEEFPQHIEYDFGTTRLLIRDKRCVAYLATRALFGGDPYITEWAGEPLDILTLVKARLEELMMDKIAITLPAWETDFSRTLCKMGINLEVGPLHGPCMLRIISPEFLRRVKDKGYGGELTDNIAQAPRSIFGTVENTRNAAPFYIWRPDVV